MSSSIEFPGQADRSSFCSSESEDGYLDPRETAGFSSRIHPDAWKWTCAIGFSAVVITGAVLVATEVSKIGGWCTLAVGAVALLALVTYLAAELVEFKPPLMLSDVPPEQQLNPYSSYTRQELAADIAWVFSGPEDEVFEPGYQEKNPDVQKATERSKLDVLEWIREVCPAEELVPWLVAIKEQEVAKLPEDTSEGFENPLFDHDQEDVEGLAGICLSEEDEAVKQAGLLRVQRALDANSSDLVKWLEASSQRRKTSFGATVGGT